MTKTGDSLLARQRRALTILAGVHRAVDDPWITAAFASDARRAWASRSVDELAEWLEADTDRRSALFDRSARARGAVGCLASGLVRWRWAPDDERDELAADIGAWNADLLMVDGSWTGRFLDAPLRYRWRLPFVDDGAAAVDRWLLDIIGPVVDRHGPPPPAYDDLADLDAAPLEAEEDPAEVDRVRGSLLAVLAERSARRTVWPDAVLGHRVARTEANLRTAGTVAALDAAWHLGDALLSVDDSWNGALCAALLAPIEASIATDGDAAVDRAATVRAELLGRGAGSSPFATALVRDRLLPNVDDEDRAAGARLGEAGFEALRALRYTEADPATADVAALLRAEPGPSQAARWLVECPIDPAEWAAVPEPGDDTRW